MIRRLVAAGVGVLVAIGVAAPGHAAAKTLQGTIALPGNNIGNVYMGYAEFVGSTPTQQICPAPGNLDGVFYKFFDLKGLYKSFKLTGPAPAVKQELPVYGGINEYDIDIHGFDEKCKRIEGGTGVTGTSPLGSETFRPKKPVRYIVVKYYAGPYPNIPFKVEYS